MPKDGPPHDEVLERRAVLIAEMLRRAAQELQAAQKALGDLLDRREDNV